jgi:hypothetical protein
MHDGHPSGQVELCRVLGARRANDQSSAANHDKVRVRDVERLSGACDDAERNEWLFVKTSLDII